jgi:hypothetical protein
MSPLFREMIWHLEQVVGVGDACLGLQRPHVNHPSLILMVQILIPSKCSICPHHHSNPLKYDVKPLMVTFLASESSRLNCEGMVRSSKVSSRHPKAIHHDLTCGPLASNLWVSIPMESQSRLVPPKLSTKQGPAKQIGTSSQDIKSKYHGK